MGLMGFGNVLINHNPSELPPGNTRFTQNTHVLTTQIGHWTDLTTLLLSLPQGIKKLQLLKK